MSRLRFGVLLAVLVVVVAVAAFTVSLSVLDDGQPDAPPRVTTTTSTTAEPGSA